MLIRLVYLLMVRLFGWLVYVPKTSSASCDQAIFVDQATDASLSCYAVLLKVDRFGTWAWVPSSRSAVNKSHARIASAWERRNCDQVGPVRRGAGSIPAFFRIWQCCMADRRAWQIALVQMIG
jgi:hypothetical protein